jgi:arginine exporter protein ArgO
MKHRLTWFFIGAAVASVFWIAVMGGIGNEWLNILLQAR